MLDWLQACYMIHLSAECIAAIQSKCAVWFVAVILCKWCLVGRLGSKGGEFPCTSTPRCTHAHKPRCVRAYSLKCDVFGWFQAVRGERSSPAHPHLHVHMHINLDVCAIGDLVVTRCLDIWQGAVLSDWRLLCFKSSFKAKQQTFLELEH